jgi:hypothetical protein
MPATMAYRSEPAGVRPTATDLQSSAKSPLISIHQDRRVDEGAVTWKRSILVRSDRIPSDVFAPDEPSTRGLRDVINDLRADASLTLAFSN